MFVMPDSLSFVSILEKFMLGYKHPSSILSALSLFSDLYMLRKIFKLKSVPQGQSLKSVTSDLFQKLI